MDLNRLHIVVFWVFFVLFLTTAASVLFFTFGYRFSFHRGIFIYTGSITVKSNPRSATVSLDGNAVPADMIHNINQSIHVTGIMPGEHFLRVSADGFQSWEKKVVVQSGISTEFWNVLLPRSSYDRARAADGDIVRVFPSPTRKYFSLVSDTGSETTVAFIERTDKTSKRVFSSRTYRFDPEDGRNVEWAKNEDSLLIPLRSRADGKRGVMIVDLKTGIATDLKDIAVAPDPENPRWHPDDNGTFFVLSRGSLLLVDPAATSSDRIENVADNVSAYDLSGRSAAVLDRTSGIVSRITFGGITGTDRKDITGPIPEADRFSAPYLTMYDERRIAVYDRDGEGFLYNDDLKLEPSIIPLGTGIRGVQFSDDGKKLLFFTGHDISVVFTRDWDVQPARKDGDILQIARFSSPLSEVQWAKDYEHVLFVNDGELNLAELDNRDRRNIATILPASTSDIIRQVVTLPAENQLYVLSGPAPTGHAVFSFISFPEPIGLFGQ
ncbi:MAG TPA: PEGA domain-containing protein [Candidatus Fimivivens sp.]|nr:PEGA domain-containing protein [Candidatus Fimivivens sp.]